MIKNKINYLTSAEAAKYLGISADYMRKLFLSGKVKGEKLGRNWVVEKSEISRMTRERSNKESLSNGTGTE